MKNQRLSVENIHQSITYAFLQPPVLLLLQIISICTISWAIYQGKHYGLFIEKNSHGNIIDFVCNDLMDNTECQLLNASKASAIISILWSFLSLLITYYRIYQIKIRKNNMIQVARIKKYLDSDLLYPVDCIVMSVNTFQICFSLICIVCYAYFKKYYFAQDDDVNVEGAGYSNSSTYSYGFYMWLASIILCFLSFLIEVSVSCYRLRSYDEELA